GFFGAVHARFKTPYKSTILTGVCVALMAATLPMQLLLNLANIGTLFAFAIVFAACLVMRKTNPEAARPCRGPLVPFTPVLGIISCLLLMFSLPGANWVRLLGWLSLGLVIYATYGRRHSVASNLGRAVASQH